MVATEHKCEAFVWELERSNLLDRELRDPIVSNFMERRPDGEPKELADLFISKKLLTRYQADRLLTGKSEGLVLGPFTVIEVLGTGSMGTVFKAVAKDDQQCYAVKVLPRRSMWNIRLAHRKVKEFEKIMHPSVVPFVDVGTAGGQHYLAWPLVEGKPLDKVVELRGKLPPALAANFALQIAGGLDECHQRQIIHGLLKPSNILVTQDHQIRILDFGIGCLLAEADNESIVDTMSTANTMASNLDCASPESIMEPKMGFAPASDQYSLGCTLYFCLTGQYPFAENNAVDKMFAHQTKTPTPIKELVPSVPDELVRIVERLMHKAPASRYPKISFAVSALKPFGAGQTPDTVPLTELRAKHMTPSAERTAKPLVTQSSVSQSTPSPVLKTAAQMPSAAPTRTSTSPASFLDRQTMLTPAQSSTPAREAPTEQIMPSKSVVRPAVVPGKVLSSPRYQSVTPKTLEDRLGQKGLFVAAGAIAALTWLLVILFT